MVEAPNICLFTRASPVCRNANEYSPTHIVSQRQTEFPVCRIGNKKIPPLSFEIGRGKSTDNLRLSI